MTNKIHTGNNLAAKDFRPINLTSFILKTVEKLIDTIIRQEPLLQGQHAYRADSSVETALYSAIIRIEEE